MSDGEEPEREPMPGVLAAAAERARVRHQRRWPAPEMVIVRSGESWAFQSPYAEADKWLCLIGEALGTRTEAVVAVFIGQLAQLVATRWVQESEADARGHWQPEESELRAALSIVASLKPRNEAQAAFAASIVATHFASMKLGAELARRQYPDPRTVASLAAINRAYASQMEAYHRIAGRSRSTRQNIKVEKHVHLHNEKHVHFPGEGGGNSGSQAQEPTRERARARAAGGPPERPALPRPDEGGNLVPLPGGEGPPPLPPSRVREGFGGAEG